MGYEISKTGFANLPKGIIQIDRDGYTLTNDMIVSGNYEVKLGSEIGARLPEARYVIYKGTIRKGEINVLEDLVLEIPRKAVDASGYRYDLRITVKPRIKFPPTFGDFSVPVMVNNGTTLGNASTDDTYNITPPFSGRVSGADTLFVIDILQDGQPVTQTTLMSFMDIDQPDVYERYEHGTAQYGVDEQYLMPYQEAVYPLGNVVSAVYMEPDTLIITNADHTGFGGSADTNSQVAATIAYLAMAPLSFRTTCSSGIIRLFANSSEYAQFTIVSRAEEGGRISPSGTKEYDYKSSAPYTITPNYGWEIKDVLVDGVSVGAVSNYTFENIRADHTIVAKFERWLPPCEKTMEPMSLCGESKLFIPDC